MGRLDGKVCFVTGAGSGIGAKTAELFAHEGASVIMADMHEENLSKVAADIQAAGGEVMTAVVNITDNDAVKAAFAAGVEKYGKIDALYKKGEIVTWTPADTARIRHLPDWGFFWDTERQCERIGMEWPLKDE